MNKLIDVDEMCPYCEVEVLLKNARLKAQQPCPNCGKEIIPCALCWEEDVNYLVTDTPKMK